MKTNKTKPKTRIPGNPWLWFVAFGILVIPLCRDTTRHIPAPAPVLESADTPDLPEPMRKGLNGEISLVFFLPQKCENSCAELAAMERLIEGRTLWKGSFQVIGVSMRKQKAGSPWTPIAVPENEYTAAQNLLVPSVTQTPQAEKNQFVLIDRSLQIRGRFPVSKEGGIEAFHKATRLTLKNLPQ